MVLGIPAFEPMSMVTPFTARDNISYLEKVNGIRNKVNELIAYVELSDIEIRSDFLESFTNVAAEFEAVRIELDSAVAGTNDALSAEIVAASNALNASISALDQRVTDMYAISNLGLDERVTDAEALVTAAVATVNDFDSRLDGVVGLAAPAETPTEMLARLADMQTGSVTIAVASDSTANDLTDWVRIWSQMYGPLLTNPNLRREYKSWNDGTQAWNAAVVDQAGVAPGASGGTILADSFTRSGEIVGSVPDTGPAWDGKAGVWTADGSYARAVAASARAIAVECKTATGAPIRNVSLSARLSMITSATAAAQQFRFMVGSPILSSDKSGIVGGLYVSINLSASGATTATLSTLINGVNTNLGTFGAVPGLVAVSAVEQMLTVSVTLNADRSCTGSIQKDGQAASTLAGTVPEADYAWMGGYAGVAMATNGASGLALDSINISTAAIPAPPKPGLMIANGSVPGSTVLYQKTRIAAMWPTKPDVLIVSTGHNDARFAPDDFIANLDSFIAACVTAWGSLPKILVSSQNPQKVGSTTYQFHADRQAAIRQWAMSHGYQYLPVFEMFTNTLPASAVSNDNIHPTTPAAYPLAAGDSTVYGSVEWAKLMNDMVNARRFR